MEKARGSTEQTVNNRPKLTTKTAQHTTTTVRAHTWANNDDCFPANVNWGLWNSKLKRKKKEKKKRGRIETASSAPTNPRQYRWPFVDQVNPHSHFEPRQSCVSFTFLFSSNSLLSSPLTRRKGKANPPASSILSHILSVSPLLHIPISLFQLNSKEWEQWLQEERG